MQVRKNLFLKKHKKKNDDYLKSINSKSYKKKLQKQAYRIQKSRSVSYKQNHRKSTSNNQHVSPLTLKKRKLNNSPSIPVRKKSKSRELSYRKNLTQRDYDKKDPMMSTKILTQRSPYMQKKKSSPVFYKKKGREINKQKTKKQGKKKETKKKKSESPEPIVQAFNETFKKKKKLPEIKTDFSGRKQSYFDEQIMARLNIKQVESIKKEGIADDADFKTFFQKKEEENMYPNKTYRQVGILTENDDFQALNTHRTIQSFRKQQEMKWRIMYLELNNIKSNGKVDKINDILDETQRNLAQFLEESKKLQNINRYVIQSPEKVRKALRKHFQSAKQKRQIVKSISQNKLLQQLENIQGGELSFVQGEQIGEKSSKHSFCIEFQKQLESYQLQNQQNSSNIFNQVEYIPQVEVQKANKLIDWVQEIMMFQFCQELASNQKIFHRYLLSVKQETKQEKVLSSNEYSEQLVVKFIQFLKQNKLTSQILERLKISFGHTPSLSLLWIRNYLNEQQQGVIEVEETPEPILDAEMLNQFDTLNYDVPIEAQYFYNHCIYGCLNELLDELRPFGIAGKPPLFLNETLHKPKFEKIQQQILQGFREITSIKMGRTQFLEEENPVEIMDKTFKKMDRLIVKEVEVKWGNHEDVLFENKYLLSETIFDMLINDEVLLLRKLL